MTDTVSVLLIIGAAVIGTIEAQESTETIYTQKALELGCRLETQSGPDGRISDCVETNIPNPGRPYAIGDLWIVKKRFESIEQLCARAVKEIGAAPDLRATQEQWEGVGQSFDRLGEERDKNNWRLGEQIVRCIPTLKGYRR